MSSKTEVSVIDPKEVAQVAMLLGAKDTPNSNSSNERLPQLKTNSKRKDPQGRKIEEGMFFLTGMDEPVYAKEVTIRVLSQMFQWLHYDQEENKVANKTLLIPNFRQEARDIKGGLRCGKPTSKVLKDLPKSEQAKYKDIKCFRQLRVLVSYTGKDADGNESTIENVPAIMLQKGANFNPFEDEFIKALPRGANLYDYPAKVTAEEMENGSVIYYVMHFEPQVSKALMLDQATFDTMKRFAELIIAENTMIEGAHNKALRQANLQDDAIEAVSSSSLEDDLEDDEAA